MRVRKKNALEGVGGTFHVFGPPIEKLWGIKNIGRGGDAHWEGDTQRLNFCDMSYQNRLSKKYSFLLESVNILKLSRFLSDLVCNYALP